MVLKIIKIFFQKVIYKLKTKVYNKLVQIIK